ncbi:hypothetical protein HELRODRAFT_185060 [Helobdella robusta]|uniref:T-complex protein 11-like protein 1 n=1 Tax=Helobdella robusta TaxID=6412 RepID=T1FMC2_HELRO|nr:hypothetical protein HELRODRAFT_185060 [Helobdella robusta]ESN99275.1 hypothetical protein HELRODRAFT_185060 [Helobdella robusta]
MAEGFSKEIVNLLASSENIPLINEISASPLLFFNMDDAMKMRERMESMFISHETALDDNFALPESFQSPNVLEARVKEVMTKAFWDILEEQLSETPPTYTQALSLLGEIKGQLAEMLPTTDNSLKLLVDEVLDLDLIKQKLDHLAFDLQTYSQFIIDIMAKICAPARDEEVMRLRTISDVVSLYREIYKVMELMLIDHANAHIKIIRPYLKEHFAEVELAKFLDILKIKLDNGVDGLLCTKVWLNNSFNNTLAKQVQLKKAVETSTTSTNTLSPPATSTTTTVSSVTAEEAELVRDFLTSANVVNIILNNAYLSLLTNTFETPETLLLDYKRVAEQKDKFGALVLTSSLLVVSASCLGRPLGDNIKSKLKSQISILAENVAKSQVKETAISIREQIVKELNDWLMNEQKLPKMSEDVETMLKDQLDNILDPNTPCPPVFRLMGQRLCEFFFEVISDRKDIQIPRGYSLFTEEINSLVKMFSTLVSYNKTVFGNIYGNIVSDLIRKCLNKIDASRNQRVDSGSNTDNFNYNIIGSNVDGAQPDGSSVD